MENQIDKLTQLVITSSNSAIEAYTRWHFVSALSWVAFGTFFILLSKSYLKIKDPHGDYEIPIKIVSSIIMLLGIFIVVVNMSNLICPRAYSIHQLIIDIRGCK